MPSGSNPITSAVEPDLGTVRQFITDMIARGAIVALVASIVGLLTRMRDLNTELMRKLASKSKKRPENEAMRRLQLELPLVFTPTPVARAANDGAPSLPAKPPEGKKKRGPNKPDPHSRPTLPAHLPRIPEVHHLADKER